MRAEDRLRGVGPRALLQQPKLGRHLPQLQVPLQRALPDPHDPHAVGEQALLAGLHREQGEDGPPGGTVDPRTVR